MNSAVKFWNTVWRKEKGKTAGKVRKCNACGISVWKMEGMFHVALRLHQAYREAQDGHLDFYTAPLDFFKFNVAFRPQRL